MNSDHDSAKIGEREPQLERHGEPSIATLVIRSAANARVDGVRNTERHSMRRQAIQKA
jgi:hypothetical protein